MKYLIISDIHGSSFYLNKVLEKINDFDTLIILGDILYHGPRNDLPNEYDPKQIMNTLNCLKDKIIAVRGNCDAEVDLMVLDFEIKDFKWLKVNNHLFYLTHGHKYNKDNIPCKRRKYTILHGHTHINKEYFVNDKVNVVNIGSLSLPKDNHHAYATIENNLLNVLDLNTDELILSIKL